MKRALIVFILLCVSFFSASAQDEEIASYDIKKSADFEFNLYEFDNSDYLYITNKSKKKKFPYDILLQLDKNGNKTKEYLIASPKDCNILFLAENNDTVKVFYRFNGDFIDNTIDITKDTALWNPYIISKNGWYMHYAVSPNKKISAIGCGYSKGIFFVINSTGKILYNKEFNNDLGNVLIDNYGTIYSHRFNDDTLYIQEMNRDTIITNTYQLDKKFVQHIGYHIDNTLSPNGDLVFASFGEYSPNGIYPFIIKYDHLTKRINVYQDTIPQDMQRSIGYCIDKWKLHHSGNSLFAHPTELIVTNKLLAFENGALLLSGEIRGGGCCGKPIVGTRDYGYDLFSGDIIKCYITDNKFNYDIIYNFKHSSFSPSNKLYAHSYHAKLVADSVIIQNNGYSDVDPIKVVVYPDGKYNTYYLYKKEYKKQNPRIEAKEYDLYYTNVKKNLTIYRSGRD